MATSLTNTALMKILLSSIVAYLTARAMASKVDSTVALLEAMELKTFKSKILMCLKPNITGKVLLTEISMFLSTWRKHQTASMTLSKCASLERLVSTAAKLRSAIQAMKMAAHNLTRSRTQRIIISMANLILITNMIRPIKSF